MKTFHYRPKNAWFGDPIPFFWKGKHHVFYLYDAGHHSQPGGRHSWAHISSRDLIHWRKHKIAISPGKEGEIDSASCGTGSVFHLNDLFHLFYLGRYINTRGEQRETICHAFSKDLITWEKNTKNPVSVPDCRLYTPDSWRDPFILWNEKEKEYWMLITARLKHKPLPLSGCIALLKSKDLKKWRLFPPFWAPGISINHECPDLFFWNGWWYLIYSTSGGTFYRRSRKLSGDWFSPPVEMLDSDFFYAGKTDFDGKRRFLFGWVSTLEGEQDFSRRQWAGHMVIRELVQDAQGYLKTKLPAEFLNLAGKEFIPEWISISGDWKIAKESVSSKNSGLAVVLSEKGPRNIYFSFKVFPEPGTRTVGLFLRTSSHLCTGYAISLDLVMDQIIVRPGRKGLVGEPITSKYLPGVLSGEKSFSVSVFFCGSLLDIFVNDEFSLVVRAYEHTDNGFGLFVQEGKAVFKQIQVRTVQLDNVD